MSKLFLSCASAEFGHLRDSFEQICNYVVHARSLHEAGRLMASGTLFREAEVLQERTSRAP